MALILSIETSTSVCSAAFHEDGDLLAVKEIRVPQSAAAQLAVQIEELFATTNLSKKKLDAVTVSSGPGSYTGLRIGVATAKGICCGLRIPLISIDSLLVLASHISDPSAYDLLCPMIDARRMEVYCSLLDNSLATIENTQAKIIDSTSFSNHLALHSILFFGDGAAKCHDHIRHQKAVFLEDVYPTAESMGKLGFQKYKLGQFENVGLFEPNYLKNFVAKTKSV